MSEKTSYIKPIITALVLILITLTLRILTVLPATSSNRIRKPKLKKRGSPTHLLIVLGSGGHTAEMCAMLRNAVLGRERAVGRIVQGSDHIKARSHKTGESQLLDWRNYTHRSWIFSAGDSVSALRAEELESEFAAFYASSTLTTTSPSRPQDPPPLGTHKIHILPRARQIHQPLRTTPLSTLKTLYTTLHLLISFTSKSSTDNPVEPPDYPDVILANGPATAAVVVMVGFLLKLSDYRGAFSRGKFRCVWVESFARVGSWSLSARLVGGLCERVLVQWEGLAAKPAEGHADSEEGRKEEGKDGRVVKTRGGKKGKGETESDAKAAIIERYNQRKRREEEAEGQGWSWLRQRAEYLGVLV